MECIIAYLLLALFIDLALEIVHMDVTADETGWIKRSFWGQNPFDCASRAVSTITTIPCQHLEVRRNRFRTVKKREVRRWSNSKNRNSLHSSKKPAVLYEGVALAK
jgi:hypothetical protein